MRKIMLWAALIGANCLLWSSSYHLVTTGHTRALHDAHRAVRLAAVTVRKARHAQVRLLGDRSATIS